MLDDDSPRPAPGSSRRRPRNSGPRNPAKHTPQRNYASENDMSNAQNLFPQTPQKSASSSPAPISAAANQSSTKREARDKARSRNLPLSPDSARTTRQSSHSTFIAKAGVAGAFAGATFHASPAPSSLPLPSFLAKGVESPTVNNGAGLGRSASSQASGIPMSTPARASSSQGAKAPFPTPSQPSPSPAARDSPLEFMFQKDREEKEQARRSGLIGNSEHKYTHPASSTSHSPIRRNSIQFREPHSPSPIRFGRQDMGRPTPEVGHHFGQSIGPSFATPYQERIRAAQNNNAPHPPKGGNREPSSHIADTADRSEALKRYLFGTPKTGGSGKNGPTFGAPAVPASTSLSFGAPLGPPRAPPPNHAENQEARDEGVVAMEDNLRRLLKLDSSIRARHPVQHSQ